MKQVTYSQRRIMLLKSLFLQAYPHTLFLKFNMPWKFKRSTEIKSYHLVGREVSILVERGNPERGGLKNTNTALMSKWR